MLWLIVALMAIATPVFIVLLRSVIQPRGRDEEENGASPAQGVAA
jgi:hypothetical protein